MKTRTWIWMALLSAGTAWAATPKPPANPEVQKAAAQYEADKKLCADERDATARLQCRRDAKSTYDQALQKAKTSAGSTSTHQAAATTCPDCGTVSAVNVEERDGESTPIGMIAGGVGGAILGNQVGGGIGKDLATVAGAVGGAYAGKKIEEKVRSHKVWIVTVQYPDNGRKSFEFAEEPKFKPGDPVRNAGNSITHR